MKTILSGWLATTFPTCTLHNSCSHLPQTRQSHTVDTSDVSLMALRRKTLVWKAAIGRSQLNSSFQCVSPQWFLLRRLDRVPQNGFLVRSCCFFVLLWPEEKCMTNVGLTQSADWLVGLASAAQLPQRQLRSLCLALFPPTLCECLATVLLVNLSSVSLTWG